MMLRGAHRGERMWRVYESGFEATIPCLGCRALFDSTDRRKVRFCDVCRVKLATRADRLGTGGEWAP